MTDTRHHDERTWTITRQQLADAIPNVSPDDLATVEGIADAILSQLTPNPSAADIAALAGDQGLDYEPSDPAGCECGHDLDWHFAFEDGFGGAGCDPPMGGCGCPRFAARDAASSEPAGQDDGAADGGEPA